MPIEDREVMLGMYIRTYARMCMYVCVCTYVYVRMCMYVGMYVGR